MTFFQTVSFKARESKHQLYMLIKLRRCKGNSAPLLVCLLCCFTSTVNSWGHVRTVSNPSRAVPGSVYQYLVYILSPFTDICSFKISARFSALCPRLTAEVMSGRSVILTTLFLGKPHRGSLPVLCTFFCHSLTFALLESEQEEEMVVEISSWKNVPDMGCTNVVP